MKLRREGGEGPVIVFEEIEPFFVDLLHRIPASADPADNAEAVERLFGSPLTEEEDEDDFNTDWQDYVEPEIRDLFRSASEIVATDLKVLPVVDASRQTEEFIFDPASFVPTGYVFEVPRKHIDAWLTTLNQARLVIAAKQGFGEREMDEDMQFPPQNERDLYLFQIHFYDFIQQVLLRELGFD